MIISKLKFTNINSGYLGTDNDFSLSVKFILSRMFFTDNEGQYLLILTTDIGYYSKLKNTKIEGSGPTDSDSISCWSVTDNA